MLRSLTFLAILVLCFVAAASNSGITYQGRILKPDGSPLAGQFTQFKMQIRTPDAGACLMYEEIQAQDLRNSNGTFSLTINDGTGSRTDVTGLTLDRIFANHGSYTLDPTTCNAGSGTWAPGSSDGRSLVVLFKDETMGTWEPIPAAKINFVPYAFESKQISGFAADSLLRVVGAGGDPLGGVSPLSNAQWVELQALLGGTSAQYTHAGQLNGAAVPAMTSGQVLGWNGTAWTSVDPLASVSSFAKAALPTCAANNFLRNNGTGALECIAPAVGGGGTVTQVNTGTGLTGGGFTTTGTISIAAGGVGTTELAASAVTSAKIADGNVTAVKLAADSVDSSKILDGSIVGADLNAGINITTTGAVSAASVTGTTVASTTSTTRDFKLYPSAGSFKITFAAPTLTADYTLLFPTDDGAPSQVLTTDGNGNLTWTTPAGTGISALTGDVTASGSGSVAATVSAVGGSTAASVHSAELAANAATSANTASTIVKRDASGNFTAGTVTANSNVTKSVVLQDSGSNTVTLQAPSSVGTSYVLKMPTAVAPSTQLLQSDSTGQLSYVAMPSALPPNGAAGGDLSGTYPNPAVATVGTSTAANVHAAELLANAATSAATNSAIVKRDGTGNFSSNVGTFNGVSLNNGGSLLNIVNPIGGAWTMTLPATAGSSGQVLTTDGAGVTTWAAAATSSQWTTHGANISYDVAGNVGIGTTSPAANLQIVSSQPDILTATSASTTGSKLKLENTDTGGQTWSINSAGSADGLGAGAFILKNESANWAPLAVSSSSAAVMIGFFPLAQGQYSVAVGEHARAYGQSAISVGAESYAMGLRASAFGSQVSAGNGTTGSGDHSIAFGAGAATAASGDWTKYPTVTGQNSFGFFMGDQSNVNVSANNAMVIMGGNVGIGTTAPVGTFDVHDATNAQLLVTNDAPTANPNSSIRLQNFRGGWGAGDPSIVSYVATGTSASPGAVGNGMKLLSLQGRGYASSGFGSDQPGATIDFLAAANWANSVVSTDITFNTGRSGTWGVSEQMRITALGKVGIGTTAPEAPLSVAGPIKIAGAGTETCDATHYIGGIRYNGGNIQFCDSVSWKTLGVAGAGITALTGDVTASGTGSVSATVASVGGYSAANVAAGATLANAATSANTASAIVKRDGSGNFVAGTVTAASNVTGSVVYKDSGSNTVTLSAPTTVSSSYSLKWPTAAAGANSVLQSDTSGNLSWVTGVAPNGAAGGDLSGTYPNPAVATVGTSTAANVHSGELLANAATSANTNSAIVKRDGSGNFTASVMTGNGVTLNNAGSLLNIVNPVGGAWTMTLPATAGSNNQVLTTNGAGLLSWTTPAGGSQWTTHGSDISYDGGGKVGIGTTAPLRGFHVENTVYIGQGYGNPGEPRLQIQANPWTETGDFSSQFIYTVYNGSANNGGVVSNLGTNILATRSGTNHIIRGTNNRVDGVAGMGATDELSGVSTYVQTSSSTTTGSLIGTAASVSNAGSGAVAQAYGLYAATSNTGSGSIAKGYGIYLDSIAGTQAWGVYQADPSNKNYFAGNVGIGTTAPAASLDVSARTDAIALPRGTTAQRPSSPTNGMMRFNTDSGLTELYQNGSWANVVTTAGPMTPAGTGGTGYLVLATTAYDGNLGGIMGANTKCRTELSSKTWMNKPGSLDTSKIFAFLCDGSTCQSPQALASYYFAVAGDASVGGAGFSTDAWSGGPGDTYNFSSSDRFGGYSGLYWSGPRGWGGSTSWDINGGSGSACVGWSSNSSSDTASTASTSTSSNYRFTGSPGTTCDSTRRLICFVNP